jgi:N utilization substance protein B
MGKRRDGREAAIQYLYQLDLNAQEFSARPEDFWKLQKDEDGQEFDASTRAYAEQLVAGVTSRLADVDRLIEKYAANYKLERIAAVDRNIIRLAIYEMFHCEDVPPVVAINEAIEIAKKFGSDESGKFVNGILDRVRGEVKRSPREAPARPRGGHRKP